VRCEDGSVFIGDLVVGADGVHSRTRREMQRIGNEEEPGLMDGDLNSEFPVNFSSSDLSSLSIYDLFSEAHYGV
jgi:hypothetical protein